MNGIQQQLWNIGFQPHQIRILANLAGGCKVLSGVWTKDKCDIEINRWSPPTNRKNGPIKFGETQLKGLIDALLKFDLTVSESTIFAEHVHVLASFVVLLEIGKQKSREKTYA